MKKSRLVVVISLLFCSMAMAEGGSELCNQQHCPDPPIHSHRQCPSTLVLSFQQCQQLYALYEQTCFTSDPKTCMRLGQKYYGPSCASYWQFIG